MEVLERLFGLLVNKVPAGFAEGLLCFFYFVFRPYRAVLRMVRFARRNNIPSRLLVAVAALLFLLASGFSHPLRAQFSLRDVANGLTQLWSAGNKVDALYVILCTFGLTVLVIFVEQCIGLLMSIRRRRLFQDFYYVAVGLTMLWWAVVVVPFVYVSLEESFDLNPIPMIFILLFFFILLVAPLLFVILVGTALVSIKSAGTTLLENSVDLQLDSRHYVRSPRLPQLSRVGLLFEVHELFGRLLLEEWRHAHRDRCRKSESGDRIH